MAYGGITERVKGTASLSLGSYGAGVAGGGGPARTTAAPQRANPANAANPPAGLQVHTAVLVLVFAEVFLLCCGRRLFKHDHGG